MGMKERKDKQRRVIEWWRKCGGGGLVLFERHIHRGRPEPQIRKSQQTSIKDKLHKDSLTAPRN